MSVKWAYGLSAVGVLALASVLCAPNSIPRDHRAGQEQCCRREATRNTGAIAGQVVDEKGEPVPGVRVEAADTAFTPTGPLPAALTDEHGEFRIQNLTPGTYNLYTEKEEDGYPYSMYAFTNVNPHYVPSATVVSGKVTPDVVIRLGPRAAKLFLRVLDSVTGKQVKDARITLYRVDNHVWKYSTSTNSDANQSKGGQKILVPPVPFTIEVSARGYRDERKEPLELTPGETKRLEIALRPLK